MQYSIAIVVSVKYWQLHPRIERPSTAEYRMMKLKKKPPHRDQYHEAYISKF